MRKAEMRFELHQYMIRKLFPFYFQRLNNLAGQQHMWGETKSCAHFLITSQKIQHGRSARFDVMQSADMIELAIDQEQVRNETKSKFIPKHEIQPKFDRKHKKAIQLPL